MDVVLYLCCLVFFLFFFFFFQAEDGIRDGRVTGVQTCALPISLRREASSRQLEDRAQRVGGAKDCARGAGGRDHELAESHRWLRAALSAEIGRASCRERV